MGKLCRDWMEDHLPICKLCGGSLRFFGEENHPEIPSLTLRTYVCDECGEVGTSVGGAADQSISPAAGSLAQATLSGFDDETTKLLGVAFEVAWQTVKASGSPFAETPYTAPARELLAKYIIGLGQQGVRDRAKLVERSLAFLAGQKAKSLRMTG